MLSPVYCQLVLAVALAAAVPALAQSGLRVPQRGEPGLDPSFARGWLAPDFDRFGFASTQWRDTIGLAPGQRMDWSYTFGNRHSFGMSLRGMRDYEYERQFSLYGRYWFAPEWALSAEAVSRESAGLKVQDLRIGVQRSF